jgi:glucose-1-phosphate thymidylyltransferase
VLIAKPFLGDDDFVMYLGDNMLQQGLIDFLARFHADREEVMALTLDSAHEDAPAPPAAQILLSPVPDPHRFGIAEVDENGHVVRLVEKPKDPPSNLALVGVYVFTGLIHKAVEAIRPSDRGELEITDAIQWLIENGFPVRHDLLDGWWLDTGKKDPLLESNRRVLEEIETRIDGEVDDASTVDGRVVIEAGARLVNSHVRGPAIIGSGTILTNAYVGPFSSVASDCEIVDSEIENSVVLDRAKITSAGRFVDSLIGRDTHVQRRGNLPKANRLMIGDDCSIDLE